MQLYQVVSQFRRDILIRHVVAQNIMQIELVLLKCGIVIRFDGVFAFCGARPVRFGETFFAPLRGC